MKINYFITYHAIERLRERFPVFTNKTPELKNWKKEDGSNSLKSVFDKIIESSEETKSYLNNSKYMVDMYEKYGYDTDFKFLEEQKENILLVLVKERKDKNFKIVSVMPTEFKPTIKNIKFNKTEKKVDKNKKNIMDLYDQYKIKEELNKEISVKEKFIELFENNKTEVVESISNSKKRRKAEIDGVEYIFLCEKTTSGERSFTFESSNYNVINIEHENIKEKFIEMFKKEETKMIEKISNSKVRRAALINGREYTFICERTQSGKRNFILENTVAEIKTNKPRI